jgi:hypothetical protein
MRKSHSRTEKDVETDGSKISPKCVIEFLSHSTSGEAGMFTVIVLTAIVVPALFIGHIASALPQPQQAVRRVRARRR